MNQNPDSHSVRRIILPSGRSIEVLRFFAADATEHQLHVCPQCASELVQPVSWDESDGGSWDLILRCPNCEWCRQGVFDSDHVDAFEEQLDAALVDMLTDLRRLTQANMADEIDRFVAALESGLLLPEDF